MMEVVHILQHHIQFSVMEKLYPGYEGNSWTLTDLGYGMSYCYTVQAVIWVWF